MMDFKILILLQIIFQDSVTFKIYHDSTHLKKKQILQPDSLNKPGVKDFQDLSKSLKLCKTNPFLNFNRKLQKRNTHPECGVRPLIESQRIIGGNSAEYGAWPWHGRIFRKVSTRLFTIGCSGVLISKKHVLTAAHCISRNYVNQTFYVELGVYDNESEDQMCEAQINEVKALKFHPEFKENVKKFDILLLFLVSPVVFTLHILPICLPSSIDLIGGKIARTAGWGKYTEGGNYPTTLQEVPLKIINMTECEMTYPSLDFSGPINESYVCAKGLQNGKDASEGDSGGPLIIEGKKKSWILVGLVSYGYTCGNKSAPGIFTNIVFFINWITKEMKTLK